MQRSSLAKSVLVVGGLRPIGTWGSRRVGFPLLELLLLPLFGELGEQAKQGEEELALLRAQVVAQFLELVHVLFDLLAFLVASELQLVDPLKHVGFALLAGLKLADVQRAPPEGPFRSLYARPLGILHALEADKAEPKHLFPRGSVPAVRLASLHELEIADFTETLEEVGQLALCVSNGHGLVHWETPEVQVLPRHLFLKLEGPHADVGLAQFLLEGRDHVELGQGACK